MDGSLGASSASEPGKTEVKTCPECREEVRAAARICRECGHLFPAEAPPIRDRPRAERRRTPNRGRATGFFTTNPWRAAALGLLVALVLGAVIASGDESGSDERPGPKELSVSFESTLSTKVDEVRQDLRPALTEHGAEESAYRVKEGSTRCREGGEDAPFRCVALLINEQGFAFSLAYSIVSVEGGCWHAQPERAELPDGRPISVDRVKLPPLGTCLSEAPADGPVSPPPPETTGGETSELRAACDPSYPDFCIQSPPPELNCPDLSQTDFTVKTEEGDPHGFDSDADGVGCEEPTPEPPGAPTEAKGPTGVLGTSSVGPVRVGMPSEQVEALFGSPERKEEVNFGGDETAPQIDWIWDLGDGEFRLQFETQGGTVTGYVSNTARLATKSGVSVGDSFDLIRDQYGDQLEESVIGEGAYLLSEGEPGSHPALTFSVDEDTITSISGGEFQPAGE